MILSEEYKKDKHKLNDKNKHLLKEVSAADVAGEFVGRAGDIVDMKFAGPYHPEFGQLKQMLKKQIESDIMKRMWTDDITPVIDPDFIDLEWNYEYDKELKKDNSKFKNTSDTEMQLVDMNIKYDKITNKSKQNKKFVNNTSNWQTIYNKKK